MMDFGEAEIMAFDGSRVVMTAEAMKRLGLTLVRHEQPNPFPFVAGEAFVLDVKTADGQNVGRISSIKYSVPTRVEFDAYGNSYLTND